MAKVAIRDKKYPGQHVWVRDHYVVFDCNTAEVEPVDAVELLKGDNFELMAPYTCPFNPRSWTPSYKRLFWESNADTFSGFGSVTMNVVKELKRQGIDVCFGGQQFDSKD